MKENRPSREDGGGRQPPQQEKSGKTPEGNRPDQSGNQGSQADKRDESPGSGQRSGVRENERDRPSRGSETGFDPDPAKRLPRYEDPPGPAIQGGTGEGDE